MKFLSLRLNSGASLGVALLLAAMCMARVQAVPVSYTAGVLGSEPLSGGFSYGQ